MTGVAPQRNRVTPTGEIVALPLRGAWTGNRGGALHRGREIVRPYASDLWITCRLEFRGRWREQWLPHRYTHLYFYDEAVAFAAGHRPCGECRHQDYLAYRNAWAAGTGTETPSARTMNRVLHAERLDHRAQRVHDLGWGGLPDGTFVLRDGVPAVAVADHLVDWTTDGYGSRHARPRTGTARVLTPPSTVAAFRAGYRPQIDDSAR
ncbi:hypothetical protein [Amycolatopsis sp. GM8]|uniref:hypothetical protein n=1 Tax=Amycolatopsis sp. GM8 TaxID=2896530 RepID=UPI001F3C13E9|nr:hypothetical protein [Amycolatopsis sp. GM8]